MGYRPVSQKKDKREVKRLKQLDKLCKERNAYVILLREYNKDCNTFMAGVTTEMIQDVDKRIAEIDQPTPPPPRGPSGVAPARLPRLNPRALEKGYPA